MIVKYLDDTSWELTRDDRIELLASMQHVIENLAAGISRIYQATTSERASERLGLAVDGLIHAVEHLEAGRAPLYPASGEVSARDLPTASISPPHQEAIRAGETLSGPAPASQQAAVHLSEQDFPGAAQPSRSGTIATEPDPDTGRPATTQRKENQQPRRHR